MGKLALSFPVHKERFSSANWGSSCPSVSPQLMFQWSHPYSCFNILLAISKWKVLANCFLGVKRCSCGKAVFSTECFLSCSQ